MMERKRGKKRLEDGRAGNKMEKGKQLIEDGRQLKDRKRIDRRKM